MYKDINFFFFLFYILPKSLCIITLFIEYMKAQSKNFWPRLVFAAAAAAPQMKSLNGNGNDSLVEAPNQPQTLPPLSPAPRFCSPRPLQSSDCHWNAMSRLLSFAAVCGLKRPVGATPYPLPLPLPHLLLLLHHVTFTRILLAQPFVCCANGVLKLNEDISLMCALCAWVFLSVVFHVAWINELFSHFC